MSQASLPRTRAPKLGDQHFRTAVISVALVHRFIFAIEIHIIPSGTVVIGGLRILEELAAIEAPQLSTLEASADARVIDLRIVLAVTCLRAATLRTVAHHDSIDKIFT